MVLKRGGQKKVELSVLVAKSSFCIQLVRCIRKSFKVPYEWADFIPVFGTGLSLLQIRSLLRPWVKATVVAVPFPVKNPLHVAVRVLQRLSPRSWSVAQTS